jgi:uncharacterized protein YecE (DUF72 family)
MNTLKGYYLGCPIWGNKDWVGELFTRDAKPKDFLAQYTSVFNTVEGNTTFYGLPSEATIARWRQDTPEGFRFAFKFSQAISHDKRLSNAEPETVLFLEMLDTLSKRTGPAFLQLPASFGPSDLPTLDGYLAALPETHAYAVEVRHDIFYTQAEAALDIVLRKHSVDRVVFDTRGLHAAHTGTPREREAQRKKPNVPVRFTATGQHPFVRFIGHPEVAENLPLLAEWAQVVAGWMREGRTPYFFLHAPDDFYAPHLARHFHALLSEHIDAGQLPPWPIEQQDPEPEQMSLF